MFYILQVDFKMEGPFGHKRSMNLLILQKALMMKKA